MTETSPLAPDPQPLSAKKRRDLIIRITVGVILLIATIVVVMYAAQKRRYNRAIELTEQGKDQEAAVELEALSNGAWWGVKSEARRELVQAYLRVASTKGLTEAVPWFEKAAALDPNVLNDEVKRQLEAGRRPPAAIPHGTREPGE